MLGASQPTDNELSLSASSGVFLNLESHDSSIDNRINDSSDIFLPVYT